MTESAKETRKGYGLFALAATIYTAGVIAFAVWSHIDHRNHLLEQIDQSLIHATHATEQILGRIFIECVVETETTFDSGYANIQHNLRRFAEDCHFDLLGAAAYKDGKLWELISGGREADAGQEESGFRPNLMNSRLTALISAMTDSGNGCIRIHTLDLEHSGETRVAVRYHSISQDSGYAILVARNTQDMNHMMQMLYVRSVGIGIFLFIMAFPLILLYNYAQVKSSRETAELHDLLQQDYVKLKERETELEDAIRDLERFNAVALGRENRIIELKAEVNTLLEQMKQHKRYNIDHVE